MAAPKKPKNTQFDTGTSKGRAAMGKTAENINRPPQTVNEYGRSIDKPMSGRESYRQHRQMVGEGKTHLRQLDQVVKDERVARGQPAVPKLPAQAKAALDKTKKKR